MKRICNRNIVESSGNESKKKIKRGLKLHRMLAGSSLLSPFIATALDVLLVYVVYLLARIEFLVLNYNYFAPSVSDGNLLHIFLSGFVFDTPGIFYTNALFILLMLFPLHLKERCGYHLFCKWVFVIVNSVFLIANIADSVYFPFTMKRTTWDTFSEFGNETNLVSIAVVETVRHWYLVVFVILIIWGMWKCYFNTGLIISNKDKEYGRFYWKYYLVMAASICVAAVICVSAIRGGWLNHWYCYILAIPLALLAARMLKKGKKTGYVPAAIAAVLLCFAPVGGLRHRDVRPIALSNANAMARKQIETPLILNTTFALLRTINSNPFRNPDYYSDAEALAIFSPERHPVSSPGGMKRKNVVVIILESFGEEYVGALNPRALGEGKAGYTPFLDSLASKSLRFTHTYCNGTKSIDAMPSILASIPKFGKPFVLTSSAMLPLDALPALLDREGYSTAFFHGARTGSMGFDGFARVVGFQNYYGREDFEKDARFEGEKEFDGYWAIWDGPFLQYYAEKMRDMKEPFMTTVFTATSHHPFNIPDGCKGKYPEGNLPIHKCVGYVDDSLRRFFATASKMPWYKNTIFVIANDHSNAHEYDEYRGSFGVFYGTLLIFDPTGETVAPELRDGIASQIDVMPTVLGILGYDKPYTAYGEDLTKVLPGGGFAVNAPYFYQYFSDGYALVFDSDKGKAQGLYEIDDHLQKRNLVNDPGKAALRDTLERRLKAMIQVYMMRRGR